MPPAGRHDKWIRAVLCRCADGRNLRVKLTTSFKTACSMEDAEARSRAVAAEIERELSRARTPESAHGREGELARRLARRADPAHEIVDVEVVFTPERRTLSSGLMRAVVAPRAPTEPPPPDSGGPLSMRGERIEAARATSEAAVERHGRVLVVLGDIPLLTKVIAALTDEFEVLTATTARQGEMFGPSSFDLVIVAHELRDGSGVALLKDAISRNPDTAGIILTARAAYAEVMQAAREAGIAPRVLFDPFDPADLLSKARTVVTLARMREAAAQLHKHRADV